MWEVILGLLGPTLEKFQSAKNTQNTRASTQERKLTYVTNVRGCNTNTSKLKRDHTGVSAGRKHQHPHWREAILVWRETNQNTVTRKSGWLSNGTQTFVFLLNLLEEDC